MIGIISKVCNYNAVEYSYPFESKQYKLCLVI